VKFQMRALVALASALSCLASAPRVAAAPMGPLQLAEAIEQRANHTSFADLERFGEAAAKGSSPESLRRLEYVALVFENQSEFDRFNYWNGLLQRKAQDLSDARFETMAQLNAMKARYDNGDATAEAEIDRVAAHEPDWYARVHAIAFQAAILIDEEKAGDALKVLSQAEDLIPAHEDPAAMAAAESDIWGTIGIALMKLKDLDGSARAFQHADFDLADRAYPKPDFDDVYNMTHLAVDLGDARLARAIGAIHHRLTLRSDLPHLDSWDRNLCAMVADAFGSPGEVTQCLDGLDARLTGAEFLAPRILPMRAIAEARLGDIVHARQDLARIEQLKVSKDFSAAAFSREPEVRAELLAAEGRHRQAFEIMRDYSRQHVQDQAHEIDAGVRQLTGELQTQLETARHSVDLQAAVVRSQRWIGVFAAMLILGAAAVLIWQRDVARRLRMAQQKAEMASRSKSEFLANMSHEIRTPLNGVVGVADLLVTAGLPERERRMAEIIRDSGQTLERLLSDVLDLAKVEAGQLSIESAPFHAGDLVRAVVELSSARADAKGLTLRAQIAPELERWFLGDAVRVRQILTNLVSNAVKFTEIGSVSILAEAPALGVMRLSVVDTGVGFDDSQKERVFGRFQQADGSITRRFGGTGLGLSICRQLASLMGGTLDCESTPGRGSRFWFEAYFEPTTAADPVVEEADQGLGDGPALRILVADDHPTNLKVVGLMLEQLGVEIVTVVDGAQAVEAVARERFDVVLMDMQMPVMDGLEATRLIRAHEAAAGHRRTPILMLSANASPEHLRASSLAGADGHVAKPVTVSALTAALAEALEPSEGLEAVA
jgi:signal transduction histidine kinase/ActR/RegA family two-component response regulator